MRKLVVAITLWLALPASAWAHPLVDRASALVLEGEYEQAAALLDEAWARDDLSRDDLIELLEARALLAHGAADEAGRDWALRALASFAPTHTFGPRFPPDLAARSVAIGRTMRGHLRVATTVTPAVRGVRLEARVEHDDLSIVRRLRYRVFDVTLGGWSEAQPPVEAVAGREVLALVEAVGPGGAVLATAGSADEPLRVRGPGYHEATTARPDADVTRGQGEVSPWLVVGIVAAALAVIAAIVIASVYAVENPQVEWQPTIPMER